MNMHIAITPSLVALLAIIVGSVTSTSSPRALGLTGNDTSDFGRSRMAFYDAFNTKDRPNCYDINVSAIPDYFSHIHFAFADLTADYQLDVSRTSDQFEALKKMPNKKIISIGIGEKFNSTMSKMLHAGVQSDEADTFAQSIGAFIDSHGLDGVSLAWSPYTGEVDQYISFLGTLRSQLPAGNTISVAIDRHFQDPKYKIKQIADAIDHFIFKAFDYHGYLDVLSQPQLYVPHSSRSLSFPPYLLEKRRKRRKKDTNKWASPNLQD